ACVLPTFPTRRSSDLSSGPMAGRANSRASSVLGLTSTAARTAPAMLRPRALLEPAPVAAPVEPHDPPESRRLEVSRGHENRFARSEEHTSELQSLAYL